MKLTKEQFIKALNAYEQMYNEEGELLNALNVNPEWTPSKWINEYYDLLSSLCEFDEDDELYRDYGTPLDWYCFEWEFGLKNAAIYEGEIERPLDTPERLYDFICESSPYHS